MASTPLFEEPKKAEVKKPLAIAESSIVFDPYTISLSKHVGNCLGDVKKAIRNYNTASEPSEKREAAQAVVAAYDVLMQHKDYRTPANPLLKDLFEQEASEEEIKAKLASYEQGREKFKAELEK